jgi:hypothetical protein
MTKFGNLRIIASSKAICPRRGEKGNMIFSWDRWLLDMHAPLSDHKVFAATLVSASARVQKFKCRSLMLKQ